MCIKLVIYPELYVGLFINYSCGCSSLCRFAVQILDFQLQEFFRYDTSNCCSRHVALAFCICMCYQVLSAELQTCVSPRTSRCVCIRVHCKVIYRSLLTQLIFYVLIITIQLSLCITTRGYLTRLTSGL